MEEARLAAEQARRRNRIIRVLVGILVIVLVGGAVFLLSKDDPPGDDTADGSTTTTDSTFPDDTDDTTDTTVPGAPVELPPGPEGRTLEGETPCPATDGSEERVAVFAQAPPTCIEEGQALTAEIGIDLVEGETTTDAGTITVALDAEAAPTMVNNFVVLARYGFYEGIPFHRLVPDFVVQAGGSGAPGADGVPDYGTTGPGYSLPDEEHPEGGYAVGDIAMARAAEVSGSQFFIVTSEQGLAPLDQAGNYPRFGRVTDGLDLAVEMSMQAAGEAPTALYVIRDVTITEA